MVFINGTGNRTQAQKFAFCHDGFLGQLLTHLSGKEIYTNIVKAGKHTSQRSILLSVGLLHIQTVRHVKVSRLCVTDTEGDLFLQGKS